MLSHKNFLTNVAAATKAVPVHSSDVFLSFLPLSHIFERTAGYYGALFSGASIYYAESAKKLPDNIRQVRPTILVSVPRIFERVYEAIINSINANSFLKRKLFFYNLKIQGQKNRSKSYNLSLRFKAALLDKLVGKKVRERLGGKLRYAISGGASLSPKVARFFNNFGIKILEGYGLTETSPVVSVNRLENFRFGTVGLPLDNVQVKISSDKEILIKGKSVMRGYWRKDKETQKVLSPGGWLKTGDLGFIDRGGFLTIIGRKKEMIITSVGKNVAPEPLENTLQLSKYILQAMVFGHRQKFISALIVPDFKVLQEYARDKGLKFRSKKDLLNKDWVFSLFEKEVKGLMSHFSPWEQVKKFILLERQFTLENEELTPTLKLRRQIIAKHYKREISALYRER